MAFVDVVCGGGKCFCCGKVGLVEININLFHSNTDFRRAFCTFFLFFPACLAYLLMNAYLSSLLPCVLVQHLAQLESGFELVFGVTGVQISKLFSLIM